MPGINTSGKPNTSDLYLGRGALFLASIITTTGRPAHFRQLGNATSFTLNVSTETLEHQNSRSGVKVTDREIILSQKIGIAMSLDELNFDNLALFLSGAAENDVTGSNQARVASASDVLLHTDALKGFSYELRDTNGNRFYDLKDAGTVTIKSGASSAANTLVAGVDYEIDKIWGTVFLLSTGSTFVNGHNLYFSYTTQSSEALLDRVNMLTTSKVSGFLRFKAINPANSDHQMLVDLHSVSLKADGDLPFIGEEFAELALTGVAEKNELGYASAPVGRIYYHTGA